MRRGRQLAGAGALAGAAAAAVAVTALAVGGGESQRDDLLPDLDVAAPGELSGRTGGTPAEPRFFLGFASAAANVGEGPLAIVGNRRTIGEPTMRIAQLVRRDDGSERRRPVRGALRYVVSPDHAHWHYLGFMRYELRRPNGTLVQPDRKTGFCLGDRYRLRTPLRGAPARPAFPEECARGEPERLRIREGISIGYGDDYDAHLEGQEFDVTGLPAGRYLVVHRVNADRRLLESGYANNAASMALELTWPKGMSQPPRVRVVARCPHAARCP